MPIVVAPATAFAPSKPVVLDSVYGDSRRSITGEALAQTFNFVSDSTEVLGDAAAIRDTGRGADDIFIVRGVGPYYPSIYGDAFEISVRAAGRDDKIFYSGARGLVYGDAREMQGQGGNDRIEVKGNTYAFGDAHFLSSGDSLSAVTGGDDYIKAGALGLAFGDASEMSQKAQGGDDRLFGVGRSVTLSGDSSDMLNDTVGGDDHLLATGGGSYLWGDASNTMRGNSRGGNDYLHTKAANGFLVGNGSAMIEHAMGGNDVLSGSRFADTLVGDGGAMEGSSSCGDDVLRGGKGNDRLYGDGLTFHSTGERGADRFVFEGASGQDRIGDFERGKDHIDVTALGYTDFSQLDIEVRGADSIVLFMGANQVTVVDVTGLTASDFLLA